VTNFISNDEIKAACLPLERAGKLLEFTRVVYRVSDAPPAIEVYGELPSYIPRGAIYGIATEEAERLVAERQRQFREVWG
jgi:hypothetical protein